MVAIPAPITAPPTRRRLQERAPRVTMYRAYAEVTIAATIDANVVSVS
jgi:hypothetical protein